MIDDNTTLNARQQEPRRSPNLIHYADTMSLSRWCKLILVATAVIVVVAIVKSEDDDDDDACVRHHASIETTTYIAAYWMRFIEADIAAGRVGRYWRAGVGASGYADNRCTLKSACAQIAALMGAQHVTCTIDKDTAATTIATGVLIIDRLPFGNTLHW